VNFACLGDVSAGHGEVSIWAVEILAIPASVTESQAGPARAPLRRVGQPMVGLRPTSARPPRHPSQVHRLPPFRRHAGNPASPGGREARRRWWKNSGGCVRALPYGSGGHRSPLRTAAEVAAHRAPSCDAASAGDGKLAALAGSRASHNRPPCRIPTAREASWRGWHRWRLRIQCASSTGRSAARSTCPVIPPNTNERVRLCP